MAPTHIEHRQALQRLRAYFTSEYRFFEWLSWEAALASLRKTPLQHVSLFGHGWCHDKAQAALNTLPNTLAGVSLGYRPSAHLKLGQDETGRVGRWAHDMRRQACAPSAGPCCALMGLTSVAVGRMYGVLAHAYPVYF